MERFIGVLGIFVLLALGYLFSSKKKQINWKLVATGIALQLILALLVLGVPAMGVNGPLAFIFSWANDIVINILNYTNRGSEFIFGRLVTDVTSFGFIFAFQVLPTIIFVGSLMGVLYYLGVMQLIVKFMAKGLQKLISWF